MPIRAEIGSTSGVTAVVGGTGAAPVIRASSVGERIGRFSIATTANTGDSAVLSEGTAISADANTLAVHQGNLDEKILGFVLVANRPGLIRRTSEVRNSPVGNFFMSKKFFLAVAGRSLHRQVRREPRRRLFGRGRTFDDRGGVLPQFRYHHRRPLLACFAFGRGDRRRIEFGEGRCFPNRTGKSKPCKPPRLPCRPRTQAEASAGSSNANRLWSAALLWTAARASAGLAFLARTLGGFTRSVSVSGGQLHVVGVDSQGNPVSVSTTISASSGGSQAHTDEQIQNICGALVATLPSFSYDAATQTLTYTVPLPADGSITLQMLATSLQNLIAGKLDTSQVKARIESDPVVLSLQAFEADLRRERVLAVSLAWTQHASGAYFRFPESGLELPDPKAGDMIRFVVAAGTATFTTPWVSYADFRSRTSSNGQPASASNGTRFADGPNDNVYFFSRQGNLLLAASENIGDYSVSPQFSEIDLKPYARLSGPLITEADLSQAIRTKLDEAHDSGLNTAQVTALITRS